MSETNTSVTLSMSGFRVHIKMAVSKSRSLIPKFTQATDAFFSRLFFLFLSIGLTEIKDEHIVPPCSTVHADVKEPTKCQTIQKCLDQKAPKYCGNQKLISFANVFRQCIRMLFVYMSLCVCNTSTI